MSINHSSDSQSGSQKKGKTPDPTILVIFGADGDLTKRKLIPAINNLAASQHLPIPFVVVGVAWSPFSNEEFRQHLTQAIRDYTSETILSEVWDELVPRLFYVQGDFLDPETYVRLQEQLADIDGNHGQHGNMLFYYATAPSFFAPITQQLGAVGLVTEREGMWRRVIIEKPFGHDVESACALNREIKQVLAEHQIYRIDHYLGKETVQNILVFRFANGIFEPVWNHRYIDHIQITVAESLGVEHRGRYYEEAGALRDMVPNHLLQLVSYIAMEPPNSFDANAVRDEKAKVLRSILPLPSLDVLRYTVAGQYGEGMIAGTSVPGYRSERNVSPSSNTKTYVAMKLFIDSWRWADIPFYIRTGKRMPKRVTEIVVQFKSAPLMLFRHTSVDQLIPNELVIRIQPNEGISLRFGAKVPGPSVKVGTVNMDFQYADYFGDAPSTGYETLLFDAMAGDATLFQRADGIELGWTIVQPILDVWDSIPPASFPNYPAGSWGPEESEALLRRDGRTWRNT